MKRANFYFERKDFSKALADFQKSRLINREISTAWLGEVNSSIELNDKNAAINALAEFTKLKPSSSLIEQLKYKINQLKWFYIKKAFKRDFIRNGFRISVFNKNKIKIIIITYLNIIHKSTKLF